jgi:ABC-type amino acid transport substrate-binding protein
VISWLVKDRPQLTVALQVPTHGELGIAFAKDNRALCNAVDDALAAIMQNGAFAALRARWIPDH